MASDEGKIEGLFYEDEDQRELEEDVNPLDQSKISQAVVSSTDWTTETVINQIDKGNIILNPSFQRRDAWDKRRKSRFIESLILGLPIPQLVLAESKARRGSYIVLDGKQRLLSIKQFSSRVGDDDYGILKLTGIDIRNDLKGKSLNDLKDNSIYYDDVSAFENQPIRTVVIKNWPNEDFLYHVFLRLNTGSVPLSPQELRQALHPGEFLKFVDEKSGESTALREILNLSKPDFRMRDAELLLRYFSFKNFLSQYTGVLKTFLDESCEKMDKEWDEIKNKLDKQLIEFEEAHKTIKEVFPEKCAYRKWTDKGYENRFNRSIFDIFMLSFSDPDVRSEVKKDKKKAEDIFKDLCVNDSEFLGAIERTTKSLHATCIRIAKWNVRLNDSYNLSLHVPAIKNNRII